MLGNAFLVVSACVLQASRCVIMPDDDLDLGNDYTYSFASSLRRCLDAREGDGAAASLLPCLNEGAVSGLARADSEDVVRVADGVSLDLEDDGDEKSTRTVLSLDKDPTHYRTAMGVLSTFLSRRSLRWDLGVIYPGLHLKVGSTPVGGVMEFRLDRRLPAFEERRLGTGRLLVRRLVLPFLVGAKISLATLVPLFFLALALIAKKAVLLGKLAVLASGFLGFNSLFLLQQPPQFQPQFQPELPLHWDRRPPPVRDDPFADVAREDAGRSSRGRNFVWEGSLTSGRD
ncbi:uncharacterized protein LOC134534464 [Bacillus rossius redtenbacheri]|uniref:uncharacterized protein LOC134534464 n=1 Tax=Bacillus rossius redtenbacheri TaxID=93214 RepID=UPI002FDD82B1